MTTANQYEDISNPDVIKKYDKQSVHFPDTDTRLDAEKAVEFVEKLPKILRYILRASFGLGVEDPVSDAMISGVMGKSEDWVYRKRQEGLMRLREMMTK